MDTLHFLLTTKSNQQQRTVYSSCFAYNQVQPTPKNRVLFLCSMKLKLPTPKNRVLFLCSMKLKLALLVFYEVEVGLEYLEYFFVL